MNLYDELIETLKANSYQVDINGNIFIEKVIIAVQEIDEALIEILLANKDLKQAYFKQIGDACVLKPKELIETLSSELKYLNSRTTYEQSIGLIIKDDFIKSNNDVVLSFPFKDTTFVGTQSKDDQKSSENYLHNVINYNDIQRLFEPKALTNIKRYSKDKVEANPTITEDDNLIIKGNNLLALHSLLDKYRGKVKLIYIDPPYNTGNDSFGYNDNFNHSTWLTFMKNRMEVAREFLSDDGVIFVSIDDNEQAYLKVLMDEVFERGNFVALFPRITKKAGKTTELVAKNTDYLLVFSKTNQLSLNMNVFEDSEYKHSDEHEDKRGLYKLSQTLDYGSIQYSKSLDYEIVIDDEIFRAGSVSKDKMVERITKNPARDYCWRWSRDLFDFGFENGFIVVKESKNGKRIYTKTYQNATIEKTKDGYSVKIIERLKPTSTLEFVENIYSNDNARKDLDKIFDEKTFAYPKPVSLLKKIISITTNTNDIILDFHAGSGTTAHAVLDLNKEDGGNRKFILIEQMDYIQDVTCKRVEKVIEKNGEGSYVYMELNKIKDFENTVLYPDMEYLPYSEIRDEMYKISQDEIEINDRFYGDE